MKRLRLLKIVKLKIEEFNSKKYVAHYTSFKALEKIIQNNELRVSSINKFNDPYENRFKFFIDRDTASSEQNHNLQIVCLTKIQHIITNHIKIFSTTGFDEENVKNLKDRHIYNKPRMWATYGDNSKGVCILFDKDKLKTILKQATHKDVIAKKIDYSQDIEKIGEEYITYSDQELLEIDYYNVEEIYKKVNSNFILEHRFFRKYYDWNTENEYRYLFFSKVSKDYTYICNIIDAISGIVLGVDNDNSSEKICNIERHLKDKPIFKGKFNDNKYDFKLFKNECKSLIEEYIKN